MKGRIDYNSIFHGVTKEGVLDMPRVGTRCNEIWAKHQLKNTSIKFYGSISVGLSVYMVYCLPLPKVLQSAQKTCILDLAVHHATCRTLNIYPNTNLISLTITIFRHCEVFNKSKM